MMGDEREEQREGLERDESGAIIPETEKEEESHVEGGGHSLRDEQDDGQQEGGGPDRT